MSVKLHAQRTIIIVIVVMFVVSSLGLTGLVVWDMARNKDKDTANNDIQAQLQEQLKNQENKLQGKKLDNYQPQAKVDKLQKFDIKTGNGKEATKDSTVTAHYTGAVAADGTIFQSSKDTGQPATFPLNQVIKGWQEGVPGMKEGGVRRLIIPAELAYAATPPQGSGIPPNAPLVFDIELVSVQ